jgi:hypothetical protein
MDERKFFRTTVPAEDLRELGRQEHKLEEKARRRAAVRRRLLARLGEELAAEENFRRRALQ